MIAGTTPRTEAYLKVTENLSERLQEVLNAIREIQPATYQQITRHLKTTTNNSTSRISDLKNLGLICSAGTTRQYGNNQDLFRLCTEQEAQEKQNLLFEKYRKDKESLEEALSHLIDLPNNGEAVRLIKNRIIYCSAKIRLLNRYKVIPHQEAN